MDKILTSKLACLDDYGDWSWVDYRFRADQIIGWWVTNDPDNDIPSLNLHLAGGHAITVQQNEQIKTWLYNNFT